MSNEEQLPIVQHRAKIMEAFKAYDTLIIIGETGSGKTTQVPKFIHQDHPNAQIAVTQPRRVAAIALAKRVAEEMGVAVGGLVGYSVRFEEASSSRTSIKYLTDGMLLRETLSDRLLSRYSVIVLDEAHERTLRTDILFGLLKRLQRMRSALKIVIMSATLNPEQFCRFFSRPHVLNIPGRQYPVRLHYSVTGQQDYLDAAIVTIFQLHRDPKRHGDFLVFLTGQEEIDTVCRVLEEHGPACTPPAPKMIVCSIYAALSASQQMAVFRKTPVGCRKIVLATNIAETSITIPGIRIVIDPGFAKIRGWNGRVGMETLSVEPISKASARQRAGRAGRQGPGECFRLYPEDSFRQLVDESLPEIQRTDLANVILTMKASGVDDVVAFDYLEAPPLDSLVRGLEELLALQALDASGRLSEMGRLMAECPLAPSLSRVLVESASLGCTVQVLSIIAMLSIDNLFAASPDERDLSMAAKRAFMHSSGDHVSLLNIFDAYCSASDPEKWCRDNHVDSKSMRTVLEIRKQLAGFCEKARIPLASCVQQDDLLKCFCAGFHTQVALLQADRTFRTLLGRHQVFIHPSSVLHTKRPDCILFHELTFTSKCYLRNVSIVDPKCVSEYINKRLK